MHVILGGTGHIGSALAHALLEQGEAVTVVTRTPSKASDLERKGARVATADVNNTEALRNVIGQGERLFLLNPPADPSMDFDAEERKTIAAMLAALDGTNLEKIVAASTYGAQSGDHMGDLGSLYEMEQALAKRPIPTAVVRGAFYMSNWDAQLPTARDNETLYTFFPPDFEVPMVDPGDIGKLAAELMTEPATATGLYHVEGPARYASNDVASAFSRALDKPVAAIQIPQDQWLHAFKTLGFSDKASVSFSNMFAATLAGQFPSPDVARRGTTSLEDYVSNLVAQSAPGPA